MDSGSWDVLKKCTSLIFTKVSSACLSCTNTYAFHPFYYSGMEIPGGKTHLSNNNNPVRLWTQLFLCAYPVSVVYFSQMDSLPALCGCCPQSLWRTVFETRVLWLRERNGAGAMKSGLYLVISAETKRADQQLESTGVAVTGSETSQGPLHTLPVLRAKTDI